MSIQTWVWWLEALILKLGGGEVRGGLGQGSPWGLGKKPSLNKEGCGARGTGKRVFLDKAERLTLW